MNEELRKAREWILSKEGSILLNSHAAQQQPIVDGVPVDVESLSIPECIEELVTFRTIYSNITKVDMSYLADEHLVDATVNHLRVWLRHFYSPDTHSCLLGWIAAALASGTN